MRVLVTRPGYRCDRCGHEWVARSGRPPRICSRCKRPLAGENASERRIDFEFWNLVDLDALVTRQGGPKIFDPHNWPRADFLPDDFDVEEFVNSIYEHRREARG